MERVLSSQGVGCYAKNKGKSSMWWKGGNYFIFMFILHTFQFIYVCRVRVAIKTYVTSMLVQWVFSVAFTPLPIPESCFDFYT